MPLVPASDYTLDDLLHTIRDLDPLWWGLLETLDGTFSDDTQIHGALASQQAVFNDLAASLNLTPDLFRFRISFSNNFSIGVAAIRKLDPPIDRVRLEQCVNESLRLWHTASARVRALLDRPPSVGSVSGLFISNGGVPKTPIDTAVILARGIDGDRQATRKHHGRAWQALCLWSAEVVAGLQAEGHPIQPGSAGENVSISGLDWKYVVPGTLLQIGTVIAEVSSYSIPCAKNARWFSDRDPQRIHFTAAGSLSRVYASVIQTGVIALHNEVRVRK